MELKEKVVSIVKNFGIFDVQDQERAVEHFMQILTSGKLELQSKQALQEIFRKSEV